MRKLTNIIEAVSLLDFEGKFLRHTEKGFRHCKKKKQCDQRDRQMASVEPHHGVTLSDHADSLSFQFNLLSLMGTFLQNACDLNSRAKRE